MFEEVFSHKVVGCNFAVVQNSVVGILPRIWINFSEHLFRTSFLKYFFVNA